MAGKTSTQISEDTASPSTGSILGYLELGNMEWKISDDAKGKSLKPKTFPYCSFHPCNAERGSTDCQLPVYPKFLVYSKDASPFQPCFHSPTSAQNSVCNTPPSCTLSLPVSPRSFVLQPTNHQAKPSTSTETPTIPPISKSPPSAPSPQFPIPSQSCTISHIPTQPQSPELHGSLGLTQYSGLQRIPSPSKVSKISKNLGFTQGPGLYKLPVLIQHPHLCKSPGPFKDSGLHKNPVTQDSGSPKSLGPLQDVCTFRSPCLTQPFGLHKNTPFPQTSDNQRSSGFMQDSGVCRSPKQNQETVFHKRQDLSPATGLPNSPGSPQDSGGYKSTDNAPDPGVSRSLGLTQDSGPQKSPHLAKDSEVNKSSGLPQESVLHNRPGLVQTWGLHKSSGLTQDSGDNNRGLTQDSDLHVNPGLTQANKLERRCGLTQDVKIYKSPEHTQDSSFYKCPGTNQDLHLHKDPALTQDSDLCTTQRLTKESSPHKDLCLILNPDFHKNAGLVPDTNASLTAKSTPSLMRLYISKEVPQENAEQHLQRHSDPLSQNLCPSKAQVIYNDLQTKISKVPVLIQLQPSSQQAGGQDCVYHSVNIVPPACQNYCQVSMHPQISWKTHSPKPGTRVGHVVFDARQRQSRVGRDKCGALSPRHLSQEAPSNSVKTTG
ncbi:uncharacterized protein SPEM3 [Rhynchonycteris naso]